MLQKDGSILITAEEVSKGISASPYVGIGHVRNLDISTPGIVRIQKKLVDSGLDIPGLIGTNAWCVALAKDPVSGDTFQGVYGREQAGFNDDVIYKNLSGASPYVGTGNITTALRDIVVFNGSLLIIGSTTIQRKILSSGTLSTLSSGLTAGNHKAFVADNICYITNGQYIATVNSAFSATDQAITLPVGITAKTLVKSSGQVFAGIQKGANAYDSSIASIYPWTESETTVGEPIMLNDYGIHQLLSEGSIIYGNAGIKNRFFATNLSASKDLPEFYMRENLGNENWMYNYPNACGLLNGEKLFGLSWGGGSPYPLGVYSYKNGAWILRNTISTGNIGDSSQVRIFAILPISQETMLVAYGDDDSYGIDITSTSNIRYSGDQAFFDSEMFVVGSPLAKKSYQQLDLLLAKALTADQSIKLQYRFSTNDSFTNFKTYTSASFESGAFSHIDTAELPDAETIQFRVILNSTSSDSIEFKHLRIF